MWREKRRNLYLKRKRRYPSRLFVVLAVFLVLSTTVVLSMVPLERSSPKPQVTIPYTPYPDRFAAKRTFRQGVLKMSHRIKLGDTLYEILLHYGASPQEIAALLSACRSHQEAKNLKNLRTGELLELFFRQGSRRIEKARYRSSEGQVLTMSRGPDGWVISRYAGPVVVSSALARGTIRDSLYQSAHDEAIPFELAMALADIFAWDIDFFVDLRAGDHYAFLYEQRFREGEFVDNGRVMVARITNAGTHHRAYYYRVPGEDADYYDAGGRSLRKQFLKSPLRYTRISSGFTKRRLHPILKIYRPHLGIDYAAPRGTPVVAVGDGRVQFRGWKGGYGRFVVLRHNSAYTTTYGHLSRYARGVKSGSLVKQGQVIGYVGASGLATGAHLDFRMKKDDRFVNPLKLRFPAARPVPSEHLAAFQQRVRHLDGQLGRALASGQSEEDGSQLSLTVSQNLK